MKILVVANQKGGVGKTAEVVHMAFDLMEQGKKVAVIDLDTQANASFSLSQFVGEVASYQLFNETGKQILCDSFKGMEDEPTICLISANDDLADVENLELGDSAYYFSKSLEALAEAGFDVCLVDTPPSLGKIMVSPLYSADFVMSPIELEAYSILGINKMMELIEGVQEHNEELEYLGMVPSKVDSRNPRHVRHYDQLREAFPDDIIPLKVGLRSSVAEALENKIPVWEVKKSAARVAAKEFKALNQYIFEKMGIK